jgi:hypothetical protein
MKKLLLLTVLMSFCVFGFSQNTLNKTVKDKKLNQKILLGTVNREGFMKKRYKDWFMQEYDSYNPNQDLIQKLVEFVPENAKITIVMGTWCSDSRREVPRFYKILDQIGFSESRVTVYCINKDFKAGDIDISGLEIKKVPTFIYYHYGYEAGRIIETPSVSLEADFYDFTQRKGKN